MKSESNSFSNERGFTCVNGWTCDCINLSINAAFCSRQYIYCYVNSIFQCALLQREPIPNLLHACKLFSVLAKQLKIWACIHLMPQLILFSLASFTAHFADAVQSQWIILLYYERKKKHTHEKLIIVNLHACKCFETFAGSAKTVSISYLLREAPRLLRRKGKCFVKSLSWNTLTATNHVSQRKRKRIFIHCRHFWTFAKRQATSHFTRCLFFSSSRYEIWDTRVMNARRQTTSWSLFCSTTQRFSYNRGQQNDRPLLFKQSM